MNKSTTDPNRSTRRKAAARIRLKKNIQWWWQTIGSSLWNKKTGKMCLDEFRADWQDSAFEYELEFRNPSRRCYPFEVPWIELTLEQRQRWRNSIDPSHITNAFSNEPALQYLLKGQAPTPRSGFSPYVRLNLKLPKERLLKLLDETIVEMQRGVKITPIKGGRPRDKWYEIELLDEESNFLPPDRLLIDTSRLSKAKRRFKV